MLCVYIHEREKYACMHSDYFIRGFIYLNNKILQKKKNIKLIFRISKSSKSSKARLFQTIATNTLFQYNAIHI